MDKFEIEQFSQLGDIIDELQFCFLDEDAYSRTPSPHEWRRATAIVHRLKLAFCELLGYAKACRQFTMEFTRERLHVVPGDKGGDPEQGQKEKTDEGIFENFTEKEILKMPKQFRKHFRTCGLTAHIRRIRGVYEIRYRRDGYNVSASHKELARAKEKFIIALCLADQKKKEPPKTEPIVELSPAEKTVFADYMFVWLETVKQPAVKETTFTDYMSIYNCHVLEDFKGYTLADVTRQKIQDVVNKHVGAGLNRMMKKYFQLLKAVLNVAVADEIISRNPAEYVSLPRYEEENGTALTLEEEKLLAERAKETPYYGAFMFLLYTGTRRSEVSSAELDEKNEWITVVSSKQRKGVTAKTRKIPVTPMLKKVLSDIDLPTIKAMQCHNFTVWLPKLLPNHHCHDLRHTFITRCQECGVPREVVSLWAGHKADNTMTSNVYTHFSADFQLKEAKKVLY